MPALALLTLSGNLSQQTTSPSGRQVGRWCRADEGSSEATLCTDYIYAVANQVDASRRKAGLPQCVPANADPDKLRKLMGRAFATDPRANVKHPAGFVAWVLLEAFDCTSDKRGKGTPHRLPGPMIPAF